jgi:hypothetical protein
MASGSFAPAFLSTSDRWESSRCTFPGAECPESWERGQRRECRPVRRSRRSGDPALVFLHHRIAQYADFFDLGFNYIPGLQETRRFHCHTYPFGRSRKNDRSR